MYLLLPPVGEAVTYDSVNLVQFACSNTKGVRVMMFGDGFVSADLICS